MAPSVYETQRAAVEETLKELDAQSVPTLDVWNKVDKAFVGLGGTHHNGDGSSGGSILEPKPEFEPEQEARLVIETSRRAAGDEGGENRRNGSPVGGTAFPADEERGVGGVPSREEVGGSKAEEGRVVVGNRGMEVVDDDGVDEVMGQGKTAAIAVGSNTVSNGNKQQWGKGEREGEEGGEEQEGFDVLSEAGGPLSKGAIRVSAATGEGLGLLLEKLDALLHLGGEGQRFAPKPLNRYRYVRVLPGQSQQ